jgi:hypothetical protein
MKKTIIKKLKEIEKVALSTGIEGAVSLEFTGVNLNDWDAAIDSITEYPRHQHFINVTPKLTVALLLG